MASTVTILAEISAASEPAPPGPESESVTISVRLSCPAGYVLGRRVRDEQ
jgi:hypothetical protein